MKLFTIICISNGLTCTSSAYVDSINSELSRFNLSRRLLLILLSRHSLLRYNLSMYATFELDESMQQSDQINQINQIRRLIDNTTRSLAVAERLHDGFCH